MQFAFHLSRVEVESVSKERAIGEINSEVAACMKCGLWENRENGVPGDGDICTRIMFIGEAPGRQEDLSGRPFVGAAGKNLDDLLHSVELTREKVYITNVVKCRPPGNRVPSKEEITTCTELYLKRQIKTIRPKFLVMLGRHSAAYILSQSGIKVQGITAIHGRVYNIHPFNFPVIAIPMFHPAAMLYNPKYRTFLERDFGILKAEIKKLTDSRSHGLDMWIS
jgi:uracil-DNA glycosylase family 4